MQARRVAAPLGAVPNLDRSQAVTKARVAVSYGKVPLSLEANQGQTDTRVKFLSRGSG